MPARRGGGERSRPPRGPARDFVPDEGRVDLPAARGRLTSLLAAALFIAGAAFALAFGTGPVGTAVLVFGGAFFGLGALVILRDLLRRGPVVSVSAHGIFDRRLSTDWIPWSALDHIGETGIGAQAFLCLYPRANRGPPCPVRVGRASPRASTASSAASGCPVRAFGAASRRSSTPSRRFGAGGAKDSPGCPGPRRTPAARARHGGGRRGGS